MSNQDLKREVEIAIQDLESCKPSSSTGWVQTQIATALSRLRAHVLPAIEATGGQSIDAESDRPIADAIALARAVALVLRKRGIKAAAHDGEICTPTRNYEVSFRKIDGDLATKRISQIADVIHAEEIARVASWGGDGDDIAAKDETKS